jgi:hypothetical protein
MKRVTFLVVFLTVLGVAERPAQATEVGSSRTFGLGFALGSPSSLVGKYFLGPSNALDFGLGFWRWRRRCVTERGVLVCDRRGFDHLSINADFLWQDNLARGTAKLDWHIGVGGRMWLWNSYWRDSDIALAARMPLGLDLTFNRPSFLEVFLEIAPALYIVPFLDLDIEAFVGVRFYF